MKQTVGIEVKLTVKSILFSVCKEKEQRFATICCQVISVDSLTLLSPQAAYYIDYRDSPLSLLSLYSIRVKKKLYWKSEIFVQ